MAWSCEDGGVSCRSVGRLVFYGARGGAFWVVFSCGNYREGCLCGEADLLRRMVRERPGGLSVPSGRSSWFGLFYMWGAVILFPLAACDGVGGDGGGGE